MLLWPNMYAPVSVRLLWGVPAKSRNLHNSAYTSRTANLALCAMPLSKCWFEFEGERGSGPEGVADVHIDGIDCPSPESGSPTLSPRVPDPEFPGPRP